MGYLILWLSFSKGWISRFQYMLTCGIIGVIFIPSLVSLDAYAFAFNEFVGSVFSFYFVLQVLRSRKKIAYGYDRIPS